MLIYNLCLEDSQGTEEQKHCPIRQSKKKAKNVVEDAAEESEDEYAGLGGVSDDSDGEEGAHDQSMINNREVVDEKLLARLNAYVFIPRAEEQKESGWLRTYVPVRDLRLLYIDGMSAGKTSNGTFDTQNRILVNDTVHEERIMNESECAKEFCRLSHEVWDDQLGRVLRMEAGFMIILCSFERDLHLLREIEVKASKGRIPRHLPQPGKDRNKTTHEFMLGRG
ncbi:uncharacterized protein EURHEDRAFT_552685 [Aspergillus ruber CBS 135680]|uniref:DNA replication checkpoint mediator MRC1 domain-containing protein n=1 Tax=Aspergillus ruber (strain CBS 135680) TaxID=1388766 RepID=A0A017SKF9_ASPRC|nr:uncharacterized protein EURHEDRAFT_552685 [Aspergillus ruber CBS 135680]EYE96810.1 hypothetical protein EURHEDRAFT_552685 [Aspergillus ruber CBS 135680]